MSHELRTPLNSLLILSDQLSKNPDGNLTHRQTDFARTIHSSGNDLLMLINDILDLSKIESGTVVVDVGELRFPDLHSYVERTFRHVAEAKGVEFVIDMDQQLPKSLLTDAKRLQQVIKNLLSNSFKFTHQGRVTLTVTPTKDGWNPENSDLNRAHSVIALSVTDTGIGISPDKQQIIFEAFQQADGSTSRKYGGTGLGLAISREISRLLGGEIRLYSAPGKGSTFTLYLPQHYTPTKRKMEAASIQPALAPPVAELAIELPEAPSISDEVGDDRHQIQPGDRVLLIVDNDLTFAKFLLDIAREQGFKGLVTSLGAAALTLTREYNPDAITLDICLPDIEGWRVLERLKNDFSTRHIPVYVISTEDADHGPQRGAAGYASKPFKTKESLESAIQTLKDYVERTTKRVLLIDRDEQSAEQMGQLSRELDAEPVRATTAEEAGAAVAEQQVDCILVPVGGPAGFVTGCLEAISRLPSRPQVPVILFSEKKLSKREAAAIRRAAGTLVVKESNSPERLLDQLMQVIHRPVTKLSQKQHDMLDRLHNPDTVLAGKKVLVVDDDIRNIFALTSIFERHKMEIGSAETGRDAIAKLKSSPDFDIVLMDIMMPEMDGLDTMREIRKMPRFRSLPMVAVTAKAMKGDREKCIEAGAWDYLSKPVDSEQLLSVLKAWLYR